MSNSRSRNSTSKSGPASTKNASSTPPADTQTVSSTSPDPTPDPTPDPKPETDSEPKPAEVTPEVKESPESTEAEEYVVGAPTTDDTAEEAQEKAIAGEFDAPSEEKDETVDERIVPQAVSAPIGRVNEQPIPAAAALTVPVQPKPAGPKVPERAPTAADAEVDALKQRADTVVITGTDADGDPVTAETAFEPAGPGYVRALSELVQTYQVGPFERSITTLLVGKGRVLAEAEAAVLRAHLRAQAARAALLPAD